MPLWQSGIRAKTACQESSESVVSRDRTRYSDGNVLALYRMPDPSLVTSTREDFEIFAAWSD